MKRFMFLLSTVAALLAGCTTPPKLSVTPETGAALVKVSVMTGGALVLNKNPRYIPVAQALGDGVSAALSGSATITTEGIAKYVTAVCEKYKVDEADIPLFVTLGTTIYDTYVATYKPTVISSTDPNALLYIFAFRDGLWSAAAIANTKR